MNTKQLSVVTLSLLLLLSPVTSAYKVTSAKEKESYWSYYTKDMGCSSVAWGVGGALVGAGAVVYGAPVAVGALGFKAAGIAAGSVGAKVMSVAATTGYGGSVVAALQSVGAAGVGVVTTVFGAAAGAAGGKAVKDKVMDCDLGGEMCKRK